MRCTHLRRHTRLRSRKPLARSKPLRKRAARAARRPDGFEDPKYLEWLRGQPCRLPDCNSRISDAHHLRHDSHGRALGAHVKDDTRAISLCRYHHHVLHTAPWNFRGIVRAEMRAWLDSQLAVQRGRYLASAAEHG